MSLKGERTGVERGQHDPLPGAVMMVGEDAHMLCLGAPRTAGCTGWGRPRGRDRGREFGPAVRHSG